MSDTMTRERKKPKPPQPPEESDLPGAVLFRPHDSRLVNAIDAYAATLRRTPREKQNRTLAMNLLIEQALRIHGLWPPADPPA